MCLSVLSQADPEDAMNSQLQLLAAVSRCYHPTAAIDPPVVLRLRWESRKAATEVLICMSRAANRQQGELGLCSAEQHPLKYEGSAASVVWDLTRMVSQTLRF